MKENVQKFFELYDLSAELRGRVAAYEAAYPGSSEIRDAYTSETLLRAAKEEGLEFTLGELAEYELALRERRHNTPVEDEPDGDDEPIYWLIDRGWTDDTSKYGSLE